MFQALEMKSFAWIGNFSFSVFSAPLFIFISDIKRVIENFISTPPGELRFRRRRDYDYAKNMFHIKTSSTFGFFFLSSSPFHKFNHCCCCRCLPDCLRRKLLTVFGCHSIIIDFSYLSLEMNSNETNDERYTGSRLTFPQFHFNLRKLLATTWRNSFMHAWIFLEIS